MLEKQIEILARMFKNMVAQIKSQQLMITCQNVKNFNVVNLYSLPPNNNSVEYVKHVDFSGYDNTKIINNFRKP